MTNTKSLFRPVKSGLLGLMKRLFTLLLATISVIALGTSVQAANFKPDTNGDISTSTTESYNNLHTAGSNVTIDSLITGDLLVAGGSILLNGPVENSLFAAGGTVTSRSTVGHHLRIAGGTVTISGLIKGDVFIAGGEVTLTSDAVVEGDLFVSGGVVTINGVIKGKTEIAAGTARLSGTLTNVRAHADRLTITDTAIINGNLTYFAPKAADISNAAKISGKTEFVEQSYQKFYAGFVKFLSVAFLLQLLGAILLLCLIVKYWPKSVLAIVERTTKKPFTALGLGALAFVVAPFLIIALLITFVGIPFAMVAIAVWLLAAVLGSLFSKILLGSWLLKLFSANKASLEVSYRSAAVGAIAAAVLTALPRIGVTIGFVLWVIGTGSALWQLREYKEK